MKEISPPAWAIIAVITLIVFSTYWSLASMLRKKSGKSDGLSISKAWRGISHPFEAENRQMEQLSKEVSQLKQPPPEDETQN